MHVFGASERGGRTEVGTSLAVGCLAYRANEAIHHHQKIHADEILTTMFFARAIVIFCHRGEDTVEEERGRVTSRTVRISGASRVMMPSGRCMVITIS